ncbi:carboxymuconolactone decarboxylase family protein [Enterobacter hormaechei]|uniref:carboxymuconolactone decarboxylase family protein n=1 Tax=Enterobacter hormaechei TaxID=158836 RepID=UPI0037529CAF
MSRINIPAITGAEGAVAQVYSEVRKVAGGGVPNLFAALGHLSPHALSAVLNAEGVLAGASLDRKDLETVKLAVSELTGCDYCVAAHHMLGKMAGLSPAALAGIRTGTSTGDAKRDALVGFVRTVMTTSGTLSDADVTAVKAAGFTDAQLADISLAIGLTVFTNTFNRVNDTTVDFPAVK